jgi:hypothetical protein
MGGRDEGGGIERKNEGREIRKKDGEMGKEGER